MYLYSEKFWINRSIHPVIVVFRGRFRSVVNNPDSIASIVVCVSDYPCQIDLIA